MRLGGNHPSRHEARKAVSAFLLPVALGVLVCIGSGCATTQSAQTKGLIADSQDPRHTEALVAQMKEAGADDVILQERFALDDKLMKGEIGQREYESEMGKLQVRMDTNRVKREKQRQNQRTALSVLQSVAGMALSAVL
ncbi:MAG: hypothetical protein KBD07_02000 [Candidatus Omnitrophica bacterium]|nr:hypothetical protein [Candidatus Omnitrophota bacterium]